MFKRIQSLLRTALFVTFILVAGHLITVGGKSISDHVNEWVAPLKPERVVNRTKSWIAELLLKTSENNDSIKGSNAAPVRESNRRTSAAQTELSDTERKKLRSLINELNSASEPEAD